MVMLTSSEPPGSSYYATRRNPFVGLPNSEGVTYNNEIIPVYSDHDARIRGVPYDDQRTSGSAQFLAITNRDSRERSSSARREVQSSLNKALVERSSSCSRAVQTSGKQKAEVKEYIKHRGNDKEYVVEEHIPPQFEYHIPSKKEQLELTLLDNAGRSQSVSPRPESSTEWIKILREPGYIYFVPLNSKEPVALQGTQQQTYYDNRRAVFAEPRESYTFKVMPSDTYNDKQLRASSYDNAVDRRSRSNSRDRALQEQVMYDVSSVALQNEKALVPLNRCQSVPPVADTEYKSQWIKIPTGPATIKVYPAISSSDPRTWVQEEPLQITNYDPREARDSHHSLAVSRSSSQNKEKLDHEFVTYENIPKPDMSLEKEKIKVDQRFDRGHKDNHGNDYRSKWVKIARGPSAHHIYNSIHSKDKDACMDPALTGYVGTRNVLEKREKSQSKEKSEYTQTSDSYINKNYNFKDSTSRVNKILNTKEDFEKKHCVDMLFNIQHLLNERQKLGVYEIPLRIKSKMNYLTKSINEISSQNKSREYDSVGSHPTESVKSILSFSNLLAPVRPDNGRTSATSRYKYMFYGSRVPRCFL